ncbi:MAG TPA: wax ester/triacylglycerol synthase family O-acyltransferase [Xanthomonadaceae bacterium]|nr:wax ester/triacylglycerol synthase family O-acyltransferase [Xanthomonadaceae bacterium]
MPGLRPLSGLDAAFLYLEGMGTPMHVGSLMILDPPKRFRGDFRQRLCEHIAGRIGRASALRRGLADAPLGLGHPLWQEQSALDLDRHVLTRRLRAPGSRAALLGLAARLHAEPLDRSLPLWQLVLIEGLDDGRLALHAKIHHALLDGEGGVALARALLDLDPAEVGHGDTKMPGAGAETMDALDAAREAAHATYQQFGRLLRGIPGVARLAAASIGAPRRTMAGIRESVLLAPRTPFNVQVGKDRAFAVADLDLSRVKAVAAAFCASLNDIVMVLCSLALRNELVRRKALPSKPLVAGMPVSLRGKGDGESNNQVSMVQCELPTDVSDPATMVRRVHAATARIKARVHAFRSLIPTDFPGLAAPLWATGLSRLWARGRISERLPPLANLVISNVPGPPVPLYLAGARVREYYPMSIVTHGLALNITVQSYAGRLQFGVLSCKDALPRPQRLADGLMHALDVLEDNPP